MAVYLCHPHARCRTPAHDLSDDRERLACFEQASHSRMAKVMEAAVMPETLRAVVQLTFQLVIAFDGSVSKADTISSLPAIPIFSLGKTK